MSRRDKLVVVVVLSLLAGFFQAGQTTARADKGGGVPPPCQKYECQTIHAYWSGDPKVEAYYVTNTSNSTTVGYNHIFSVGQIEKNPLVWAPTRVDVDDKRFFNCTPTCGKSVPDLGGAPTWQWTQVVTEIGDGYVPDDNQPHRRDICSPDPDGNGVLSYDQKNPNNQGVNPPSGL